MKFLKTTLLLSFLSAGILQTTAQTTNKVGINTNNPTEILDVNGTMRVRDLPINGGETGIYNGKDDNYETPYVQQNIVVADANGVLGIGGSIAQPLRWFYMPPINLPIDESDPAYSTGTGEFTVNLYNEYKSQFTNPIKYSSVTTLPNTYDANKLDYYVLYYDTKVFENVSISDVGVLKYKLKAGGTVTPETFFTIIYRVR